MPNRCSAWKCPNNPHCKKKADCPRIYYYSLQVICRRNPDRFDDFLRTIGYTGNLEHLQNHVICSAHFTGDAFQPFELSRVANSSKQLKQPIRGPRLKRDAWPTLNLVKIPDCDTPEVKRRRTSEMEQCKNAQYYVTQSFDHSAENTSLVHSKLPLEDAKCSPGNFVAFGLDPLVDTEGISPMQLGGTDYTEEPKDIIPSGQIQLEPSEDRIPSQQLRKFEEILLPEHHIKSEPLEETKSYQGSLEKIEDILVENIKSESYHSGDMECVGIKADIVPSNQFQGESLTDGILSEQFSDTENGIPSQEYHIKLEPLEDGVRSRQLSDTEQEIPSQQCNITLKPIQNLFSTHEITDSECIRNEISSQHFENGMLHLQLVNLEKLGYEIPSCYIQSERIEEYYVVDGNPSQITDTEFLDVSKVTKSDENESTFQIDPLQLYYKKSNQKVYSNTAKFKIKSVVGNVKEQSIASCSDVKQAENNQKTEEISKLNTDTTNIIKSAKETSVNMEEKPIASCSDTNQVENIEKSEEIAKMKTETTDVKKSTKETSMNEGEKTIASCSDKKQVENNEKTKQIVKIKIYTTDMKKSTIETSVNKGEKPISSCSGTVKIEKIEEMDTDTFTETIVGKKFESFRSRFMCLICYRTDNEISSYSFRYLNDHLDSHVDTSFRICACSMKCISINEYYSHLKLNRCTNDINFTGYVCNKSEMKTNTQWLVCKYKQCSASILNHCNKVTHETHMHFCDINQIKLSVLLMVTYFKCPTCNVTFKNQDLFYAHCTTPILFPESLNYCTKCLLSFESIQAYSAHMKTNNHALECQLCHKILYDVLKLIHHKTHEHNVRKVFCSGCSDTVEVDEFMDAHAYACFKTDKPPFVCTLCGVKCESYRDLILHLKMEVSLLKNPQFQCRRCHNYFCSKFNLCCHMMECGRDTKSIRKSMELALEPTCKYEITTQNSHSVGQMDDDESD